MTKVILILLTVFLSACNVAEKTAPDKKSLTPTNTVINNNLAPTFLNFHQASTSINESNTTVNLYIERTGDLTQNITALVRVTGNLNPNVDLGVIQADGSPVNLLSTVPYTFEVNMPADASQAHLQIPIIDNSIYEPNKLAAFSFFNPTNYDVISPSTFGLNIINNDPLPNVSFAGANPTINEGDSTTLTLSLSNPSSSAIYVPLTVSGTASSSDHDFTEQIITFNAGVTTQNITINALNDAYNEVSETLIISIGNPLGATVGTFASETITILDISPAPEVNFLSATYAVDEDSLGTNTVQVFAQLTGTLEQQITVPVLITGTAINGQDYVISSSNLVFAANTLDPISSITITTIDDNLYEGDEDIIFTLVATAQSTVGATNISTITIDDDEFNAGPPQISFIESTQLTQEGTTYLLTLVMDKPSAFNHSVDYVIDDSAPNSATLTDDYIFGTALTGTMTIPSGVTYLQMPIIIKNDNHLDDNEILDITISNPTAGAVLGANDNLILTIREAGTLPLISFASANQIASEGTNATVTVNLSTASQYPINFDLIVNSASSAIPADYTTLLSHTIPAGQTSYNFDVTLIADGIDEPQEELTLLLLQPNNIGMGAISSHRIRIEDMDPATEVNLSVASNTLNEGDSSSFTITKTTPTAFTLYIPYTITGTATPGVDHSLTNGVAVIPASANDVTVNFDIYNDNLYEGAIPETLIITLGLGTNYTIGAANTETIDIVEITPLPEVAFLNTALTYHENDIVSVPIVLNAPTNADTTVNYSLNHLTASALDHNLTAGSVVIPAGQTMAVISFQIKHDLIYEGPVPETFEIILDSTDDPLMAVIDGTADTTTISIIDIDPVPQIYFIEMSKSVIEGTSDFQVPIHLSHGSTFPIDVNLTLSEGSSTYPADSNDFGIDVTSPYWIASAAAAAPDIYTATVRFAPETITTYLTLELDGVYDNNLYEDPEEVVINITGFIGDATIHPTNTQYVLTLLDDESYPELSIVASNPTVTEGTWDEVTRAFDENEFFTLTLTPATEHLTVTVNVTFNGTAWGNSAIDNNDTQFQTGDYEITSGGVPSMLLLWGGFSRTVTFNPGDTIEIFDVKIASDSKYENDETINATVTSVINANITLPSVSMTILNDDVTKPFLKITTPLPVNTKEYESLSAVTIGIETQSGGYTGSAASDVPIVVHYAMRGKRRAGALFTTWQTGTINLTGTVFGSGFIAPLPLNTNSFGYDMRALEYIEFYLYNPDEAELDAGEPYYNAGAMFNNHFFPIPAYQGIINLDFDDLDVAVSRGSSIQNLAGSEFFYEGHTCTTYRGLVSCFGKNNKGQLGRGTNTNFGLDPSHNVTLQANVINLGTDGNGHPLYVTKLALGEAHSCALFSNNKMKCWGDNQYGQLGLGTTQAQIGTSPGEMGNNLAFLNLGTTSTIVSIHAMHWSTCAVFTNGKARCWGRNDLGQLGLEHNNNIGISSSQMGSALQEVKSLSNIQLFATGAHHACAKTSGAELKCWGYGTYGQLGLNQTQVSTDVYTVGSTPGSMALNNVNIDNIADITSIQAGRYHTCVTFNTDSHPSFNTRCWGDNFYGQLGISRVTRAGRYTDSETSCNWGNSNCTDRLGINYSNALGQVELLEPSGHSVAVGNNGIPKKPSTTSTDWEIPVGVTNNQFVQLAYPLKNLAGGETYTCGVTQMTYGAGPALTVRCWGANIIISGNRYSASPTYMDHGFLNNNGHTPWNDNIGDYTNLSGYCEPPWTMGACPFSSSLKIIGDQSGSANGNVYSNDWYNSAPSVTYNYGFTPDFIKAGVASTWLDHEMHAYSHSKFNWGAANDIEIKGGDHHVCALPKFAGGSPNNNQLRCWGNNYAGQLGIPWTHIASCGARTVGHVWACGAGNGQTLTFNYNF